MAVIAIDLGGTKSLAALISNKGDILNRQKTEITRKSGPLVSEILQKQIHKLFTIARKSNQDVTAVGVSVPGIYYTATGNVWAPNITGWDNYPLLKELNAQFPNNTIRIDSDRSCYILGETWQGAAQGCRDAIFVAVGTGIGAGILINGQILRGHNDIAGATGWMALNRDYRSEYRRYGCFEYHASGDGLARVARDLMNRNPDYYGLLRRPLPEHINSYDVFEAYNAGDPLAQTVIRQAITYWGMAAANYISLFNPEVIIFGGGVFGPAAKFLGDIKKEAAKWSQPISYKMVKIKITSLGEDAGLLGAGRLALISQTSPRMTSRLSS